MSYKVFISYRRADSEGIAGRIYDNLIQRLPSQNVFIDVDSIAKGADFVDVMTSQVSAAHIILVVIGANWINAKDSSGKRRLENPDDPVRLELTKAINESKVIIPILVGKAEMPSQSKLPVELAALSRRNAERITHENFQMDVIRLFQAMELAASVILSNVIAHNPIDDGLNSDFSADERLELDEFEAALNSGNVEQLRFHITRWPNGQSLKPALIELEKLDWQIASTSKEVEVLQWFINTYPNGDQAKQAKMLMTHIAAMSQPDVTGGKHQTDAEYDGRVQLRSATERRKQKLSRRSFLPFGVAVVGSLGFLTWRFGGIRGGPSLKPIVTVTSETKIFCSAFSPDGEKFVTAAYEDTVRVWDSHSGAALESFRGLPGPIYWAGYSPDGRYLAAASANNSAIVWNANDGTSVQLLVGHQEAVQCIEFSKDGSMVATCSNDGQVRLWEVGSWKLTAVLDNRGSQAYFVSFSPSGSQIAVSLGDATVAIWDVKTHSRRFLLSGHQYRVWSSSFSPDGATIVTASEDKTIRFWDSETGQQKALFIGHSESVNFAEFSPDGRYLVSASVDNSVRLWDVKSKAKINSAIVHRSGVGTARFDQSGEKIVTSSQDGTSVILEL